MRKVCGVCVCVHCVHGVKQIRGQSLSAQAIFRINYINVLMCVRNMDDRRYIEIWGSEFMAFLNYWIMTPLAHTTYSPILLFIRYIYIFVIFVINIFFSSFCLRRCEHAQTTSWKNHIHTRPIGCAGGSVQQDTVSGYIHARRGCRQN